MFVVIISEFEILATNVLNKCYQMNKSRAQKLLVRNLDMWGDKTLYVLAADSSVQMDFMEHTCCQTKLNQIWKGKMTLSTSIFKVCRIETTHGVHFNLLSGNACF